MLLTLHKLDHDAFRHADEGQTQARITGQRANGDLGTLGAQVLDGGVHIIGRQTVMLQPVMGKGGAGAFGSCR